MTCALPKFNEELPLTKAVFLISDVSPLDTDDVTR